MINWLNKLLTPYFWAADYLIQHMQWSNPTVKQRILYRFAVLFFILFKPLWGIVQGFNCRDGRIDRREFNSYVEKYLEDRASRVRYFCD